MYVLGGKHSSQLRNQKKGIASQVRWLLKLATVLLTKP